MGVVGRSWKNLVLGLSVALWSACSPLAALKKNLQPISAPPEPIVSEGGKAVFVAEVYPKLRQNCAGCHAGGIQAALASDNVDTAYAESRRFINFSSSDQSALLIRSTNNHCGLPAMCGLPVSVLQQPIANWVQAEIAQSSANSSTLRRTSAIMMAQRLQRLFPTFNPDLILSGTGLGQSLGYADFNVLYTAVLSTSPLAIGHLRYEIAQRCGQANNLYSATGVQIPGETLPSALPLYYGVLAARNAWGFPYRANDPEIVELASLYTQVAGGSGENANAKKALCMAALLAPQFWLGNPGRLDVVRKLAMDLGNRFPTMQEYADYESGALTASAFTDRLMDESGYRKTVAQWHREWLGMRDFKKYYEALGDFRQIGGVGDETSWTPIGASSQGVTIRPIPGAAAGALPEAFIIRHHQYPGVTPFYSDSEQCDPSKLDQPFDADSTKIEWQHRHPVSRAWETVGSWTLVGNVWQHQPGSVTLASGAQMTTDLRDIVWADYIPGSNPPMFRYKDDDTANSRFIGTHFETFGTADRRVLRYGKMGVLQNGYSRVRMWWSGQEVYVCNTATRFIASCAYRPLTSSVRATSGGDALAAPYISNYSYWTNGQKYNANWINPAKPAVSHMLISDGRTWLKDSVVHPTVLESFSCGVSNPDLLGSAAVPSAAQEAAAYPKLAPYNAIAWNLRGHWYGDHMYEWAATPEGQAIGKAADDLRLEPDRLVEYILEGRRDYRELLKADYTRGSRALELLYHSQAYWLSKYPTSMSVNPQSAGWETTQIHTISQSDIAVVPKNWFRNAIHPGQPYSIGFEAGEVGLHARTFSGILTMPAFLSQTGNKVRSLSARIFKTLTCGEVNGFVPTASQQTTHLAFVPNVEASGVNHVSNPQCLACHINLDPLGAALSKGFLQFQGGGVIRLAGPDAGGLPGGELQSYVIHDSLRGFTYGLRGRSNRPSNGAVMGVQTNSIRDVGTVIADSPHFARCAVQKAFEGLFGRGPASPAEIELMQSTAELFRGSLGFDYSKMVKELATSPLYLEEN